MNMNITLEEVIIKLREKLELEQYNNVVLEISINKLNEKAVEQEKEIEKLKNIVAQYEESNKPK